jgi:hypothetical protein
MPAKKLPPTSVEICDDLIDGVCIAEMLHHLTTERAKRAKAYVWKIRPRKRQKRRSDLEPFLALIETHIKENGGNKSKACRDVGAIIGEDYKRLWNLLHAARRRKAKATVKM